MDWLKDLTVGSEVLHQYQADNNFARVVRETPKTLVLSDGLKFWKEYGDEIGNPRRNLVEPCTKTYILAEERRLRKIISNSIAQMSTAQLESLTKVIKDITDQ